jgi:T-complex protein 1 subunit theta
VSFAGELLKLAEELLVQGLHPSEVVAGYKTASDFTLALLPSLVCHSVTDPRDEAQLRQAVKSVLMAKQLGYEDVLSSLVAEASLVVMAKDGPASMKAESIRWVSKASLRSHRSVLAYLPHPP